MDLLSLTLADRPVAFALAGPETDLRALAPVEAEHVKRALPKRAHEFRLGRHCAHAALRAFDCAPSALPRTTSGAPAWPDGMVGSISHANGYAVAVVGSSRDFVGLGIDLEPMSEKLATVNRHLFLHDSERAALEDLRLSDEGRADDPPPELSVGERVLAMFALKEAFLKCAYATGALTSDTTPPLSSMALRPLPVWPGETVSCQVGRTIAQGRFDINGRWIAAIAWQASADSCPTGCSANTSPTG